mgnify:CR=1 FL=1
MLQSDNIEEGGIWRLFLISQDPKRTGDLEIYKSNYLIGRDSNAADGVIVSNPKISRLHCRIDFTEEGYFITDLNSLNGTILNDEDITPGLSYGIKNGDVISIAGTRYAVILKFEFS